MLEAEKTQIRSHVIAVDDAIRFQRDELQGAIRVLQSRLDALDTVDTLTWAEAVEARFNEVPQRTFADLNKVAADEKNRLLNKIELI